MAKDAPRRRATNRQDRDRKRVEALCARVRDLAEHNRKECLDPAREALDLALVIGDSHCEAEARRSLAVALAIHGNIEEARGEVLHALQLAEEIGAMPIVCRALVTLGMLHGSSGNIDEALECMFRALNLYEFYPDPGQQAMLLNNIGRYYRLLGDFAQALHYFSLALEMHRSLGNTDRLAANLNSIGAVYCELNDLEGAMQYLGDAHELAMSGSSVITRLSSLINIGVVSLFLGKPAQAMEFLHQGLALAEELQDVVSIASIHTNIGTVHERLGQASAALNSYMNSLAALENGEYLLPEATALESLAGLLFKLKEYDSAREYCAKALALNRKFGRRGGEVAMLILQANGLLQAGDSAAAVAAFREALKVAEGTGNPHLLAQAHEELAEAYAHLGDTSAQRRHLARRDSLRDSRREERKRREAERILQDFEKRKALRELAARSAQPSARLSGPLLSMMNSLMERGLRLAPDIEDAALSHAAKAGPEVLVQTFGRFRLLIDGREIPPEAFKRKKARDIFKFLLLHHAKAVSTDELIDALWPDSATANHAPSVWNAISYIRKALEPDLKPHMPSRYLSMVDKSYTLDFGGQAVIDFVQFRALFEQGRRCNDSGERCALFEQAIALYKGDFLKEDAFEEWSAFNRESLKEHYIEALLSNAAYYRRNSAPERAAAAAHAVLECDHTHEEACAFLLAVLREQGHEQEARRLYRRFREAYRTAFGEEPRSMPASDER